MCVGMAGIGTALSAEGLRSVEGMKAEGDSRIVVVMGAEGLESAESTIAVMVDTGQRMGPGEAATGQPLMMPPQLRDHVSSCNHAANQLRNLML